MEREKAIEWQKMLKSSRIKFEINTVLYYLYQKNKKEMNGLIIKNYECANTAWGETIIHSNNVKGRDAKADIAMRPFLPSGLPCLRVCVWKSVFMRIRQAFSKIICCGTQTCFTNCK